MSEPVDALPRSVHEKGGAHNGGGIHDKGGIHDPSADEAGGHAPGWHLANGERRSRRRWVPYVAGLLTFLVGVRDIATVVRPALWERVKVIDHVLPGTVDTALVHGAAAGALVVAGALLILLSHALRRRKRRAWQAVVAILAIGLVLHFVHRPDLGDIAAWLPLDATMLIALLVYRAEFFARGDPTTRWRALFAFVGLGAASFAVGVLTIELRRHEIVGGLTLGRLAQQVAYGLVGIAGPLRFHSDRATDLTASTLFAMGALTAFTTAYLALRPAEPRASLDAGDEARMRELLKAHGERDSLGYFALRRDKSVIWSASGKSCVAYRVISGVMLASGDPLGDPEAWPGAIHAFMAEAERHAWAPAVLGCGELGGEVWTRETQMSALEFGDEAVVEVADFTLDGRTMRNVRQMVNRVERAGYTTQVSRIRDLTASQCELYRRQADSWRGAETERGYSMALGRFGDPADGDCVGVAALKDGALRAFLHFVPWGDDGLSLDLMRRDRSADPGLNEYLITSALRACPELGVARVSLNFAVFRSALERGGKLGAGPVIRAWRALLVFASRWFQIESLYRFNAKFQPDWLPRFVVYPAMRDLPRIAMAALEAEAFIVWPHPTVRQLRKLLRLGPAA